MNLFNRPLLKSVADRGFIAISSDLIGRIDFNRNVSVFMKKQAKVDPEIAKLRELRKRRKLEKEIRGLKLHSKKPKPIMEMKIDIKASKNLNERIRPVTAELSESECDERYYASRDYCLSRNRLMRLDDEWIWKSIRLQEKALNELKNLSMELYEAAIQSDEYIENGKVFHGPTLTPPLKDYEPPDGDYIDITRQWQ